LLYIDLRQVPVASVGRYATMISLSLVETDGQTRMNHLDVKQEWPFVKKIFRNLHIYGEMPSVGIYTYIPAVLRTYRSRHES